jgi:hypothetical protein
MLKTTVGVVTNLTRLLNLMEHLPNCFFTMNIVNTDEVANALMVCFFIIYVSCLSCKRGVIVIHVV